MPSPGGCFSPLTWIEPANPVGSTKTSDCGAAARKCGTTAVKKALSVVASKPAMSAFEPHPGSLIGSKPTTPGSSRKRASITSHAARYCACTGEPLAQNASNAACTLLSWKYSNDHPGQSWCGACAPGTVHVGKPSPQ